MLVLLDGGLMYLLSPPVLLCIKHVPPSSIQFLDLDLEVLGTMFYPRAHSLGEHHQIESSVMMGMLYICTDLIAQLKCGQ